MTLKTLINRAQDKLSLPRSSTVMASTDSNVALLRELATEEGEVLSRAYNWQGITKEQTFTSVASSVQTGAVPSDYQRIVNGSFFNRSQQRRITGPLTSDEWQAQQALTTAFLLDAFRFRGDDILIVPTPDAGDTYAFEYVSNQWCKSTGDVNQSVWMADEDTALLPENLIRLGVIWRFRKARGFDYAEEFNTYEFEVAQEKMRDGGKRTLNYGNDTSLLDSYKGPAVIEGSWVL